MLKEVGTSGQISLGKRLAGQLFQVIFHADGRVEMLPVRAVPAALTSTIAATKAVTNAAEKPAAPPKSVTERPVADGWLPPGGYATCNAWSIENRLALDDYAARIEREGTAAEQLLGFLATAEAGSGT